MTKKLTLDEFIKKAQKKHNNLYSYEFVDNYENTYSSIKILCSIHGIFEQKVVAHLRGQGCWFCGVEKRSKTQKLKEEDVLNKIKDIFGESLDYSEFIYHRFDKKSIFICKEHGKFEKHICHILNGQGCPKCGHKRAGIKPKYSFDDFLIMAKKIHGDKYDYSLSEYSCVSEKIKIICDRHGEFWQTPQHHVYRGNGCQFCNESHGERIILEVLKKNSINFKRQKTFVGCLDKSFLKFDFFLIDYNICIECDGEQHFEDCNKFFLRCKLEDIQRRDGIKNKFCKDNNIFLLRIPYYEINKIEEKILEFLFVNKKEYSVREVLCSE